MQRLPVRAIVGLLASVVATSCAPGPRDPLSGETLIVFPPPPDTARIQFLTRISGSDDVVRKRRSFWRLLVGDDDEASAARPIIKPYGLSVHRGKLYICDSILAGLEIVDVGEGTFEYFTPRGEGKLEKPINCFVDKTDGLLYVADTERRQVVVFDESQRYVTSFGEMQGMRPTDVFVEGEQIWVVDLAGRQVRVYDRISKQLTASFPNLPPDTPGVLYSPTNLYVTADRVYVTDFGDFKVKIYTRDGEFLGSVGSYGRQLGQFVRPKGIAVDRDLNLYVVDAGFENVQMFNRDGQLLMFFGGRYEGPGDMWLPAKVVIDYDNLPYFERYVDPRFRLKYLIFVTNQYGPDKVSVYGFVEPQRP